MKTLEDVKNCPICGAEGKVVSKSITDRFTTAHVLHCQNEKCNWFETGWVVETKSDGSVVERDTTSNRNKQFPKLTDAQKSYAQNEIDRAKREGW